jgi:hypothetical protein
LIPGTLVNYGAEHKTALTCSVERCLKIKNLQSQRLVLACSLFLGRNSKNSCSSSNLFHARQSIGPRALSETFFLTLKKKIFNCCVFFRPSRPAFPEIYRPQLEKLMQQQQFVSCAPINWATCAQ